MADDEPLHVTNGDSAGNVLRRSSVRGPVLPWQDVLHEGPLAPVGAPKLRDLRAAYLAGAGWGDHDAIRSELRRRDELLLGALADRRPIVLWFEHDLFDQLQVLQVLAQIAESGAGTDHVELVIVGEVAGRPSFRGLGELSPEELPALWERRRPLTDEILELGLAAWTALCAPDPRAVDAFARSESTALPYLAPALRRLLEELPDATSGLARTERQVLEAIDGGAGTPLQAFLANAEREEAPFLGDAILWLRLHELGRGEGRLLETSGGAPVPPPLGDGGFAAIQLVLTQTGRAVVAGELDRVEALGLDRWLVGTHLRPGNVWRWDRAGARLVAP